MNDTHPGIYRGKMSFDDGFTMIPNHWIRKTGLQPMTNFLLVYLLTHEVGYEIKFDQIERETNIGIRGIRSAIKELTEAGFLKAERQRQKDGRMGSYRYTIISPFECDSIEPEATVLNATVVQATVVQRTDIKNTNTKKTTVKENKDFKNIKKPFLLPENWQPNERLLEMFSTKWPLLDKDEQIESFRLYYQASDKKFTDWDLTFQRWMNRAQGWAKEKQPDSVYANVKGYK